MWILKLRILKASTAFLLDVREIFVVYTLVVKRLFNDTSTDSNNNYNNNGT